MNWRDRLPRLAETRAKDMNIRAECKNLLCDERGATAIEYGLMTALIAVALIAILSSLGSQMSTVFSEISSAAK
jgi:pilus assembly protein Flp/PilA